MPQAVSELKEFWGGVEHSSIFDTQFPVLFKTFFSYANNFVRAFSRTKANLQHDLSLLNIGPLKELLTELIDFSAIHQNIETGHLDALVVTATQYSTSNTIHFIESREKFKLWERFQCEPIASNISLDHVIASSSIPFFFPAHKVGAEYYGDGSIRNTSPLSPSIHLGADKICVIGLRNHEHEVAQSKKLHPSISRISSVLLNTLFLDAIDSDLELLQLKNKICRDVCELEDRHIRPIETLYIRPSKDIGQIAYRHIKDLPVQLRRFMLSLGTLEEASSLVSYLFFESKYCTELIELGYDDAMAQKEEILAFFQT